MHLRALESITIIYIFLILLEAPALLFLIGISRESSLLLTPASQRTGVRACVRARQGRAAPLHFLKVIHLNAR